MIIVGIAGDVKDNPTDSHAPPVIYTPFLQNPSFGNFVALRASTDPVALAGAVREVAHRLGNDLSIQEIRLMEDVVAAAVASERFTLQVVGIFAAVALILALIGVYGVISYTVSRRAREFAIRSAIGAQPADTLRLLLTQSAKPILAGLILGAVAALFLTRLLSGLLFQVSGRDPLTFAAVPVLLALGALAACIQPARRAMRLDPMTILRSE
jgi:putative ABC transport system permease protein